MSLKNRVIRFLNFQQFVDEEQRRIGSIVSIVNACLILGFFLLITLSFITIDYRALIPNSVMLALLLFSAYKVIKGDIQFSLSLILWGLYFNLFYNMVTFDGLHDTVLVAFPGLLIIAALVLRGWSFYIFASVTWFSIMLIGLFEIKGILVNSYSSRSNYTDLINILVIIALTVVIVRFLSVSFRRRSHTKELELKESEEFHRKLVATVPDIILRTDLEGNILFINETIFPSLTYYPSERVMGKNILSLIVPKDRGMAAEQLKKLYDGQSRLVEWGIIFDERTTITCEVNMNMLKDGNDMPYQVVYIVRDISERKLVEKTLREAKEKAEQMNKLKSNFLAQMSHEIRTPVNTILSFISLIKSDLEDKVDADTAVGFKVIDSGGKRLIRTIDMILTMSQLQAGSYEVVLGKIDLFVTIKKLFDEFKNTAKLKHLDFILINELNRSDIIGDEYSIMQLFQNLIDNAIKYTREGIVEIKIYENNNHKLCVDVKDSGIGIGQNYLKNIFDPFSQEETGYSRRFEGNGLGLALVKKYAEINNITIDVQSEKNVGTLFTVLFSS